MNQKQEMFVDDKFIVVYQSPRVYCEHKAVVDKSDLMATLEWHKKRGNLISYVPYTGIMEDKHLWGVDEGEWNWINQFRKPQYQTSTRSPKILSDSKLENSTDLTWRLQDPRMERPLQASRDQVSSMDVSKGEV